MSIIEDAMAKNPKSLEERLKDLEKRTDRIARNQQKVTKAFSQEPLNTFKIIGRLVSLDALIERLAEVEKQLSGDNPNENHEG